MRMQADSFFLRFMKREKKMTCAHTHSRACARAGTEFLGLKGGEELVLLDLEAIRQHLA
jgi:hypothetical protein